jgi:class 3 adenylate cyclase
MLRAAFADHAGREVDTQGDSFFVVFERAHDAALAAVDAQRALVAHLWPDDGIIRVRMGLHTAEPHVWAEGYVGVGVHRASRVCAVGHGGQILLSRSTAGLIDDDELDGISLRDLGAHRLKGLQNSERIFQLVVDGLPSEYPPLDTLEDTGSGTETVTLVFADTEDFTALVRELSPDQFRVLVADLTRTLQTAMEEAGGRDVVVVGDAVLAVFRSARTALAAAIRLRALVVARKWPARRRLTLRIGVHSGEIVATAYGPWGRAVHLASSLSDRARGGRVLVSEATRSLLDADELAFLCDAGTEVFGAESMRVYEVVTPETFAQRGASVAPAVASK